MRMNKYLLALAAVAVLGASALVPLRGFADTIVFTTQLDPGARGSEVLKLQTFLSARPDIYPSGLVTGYYGPLTKAAVIRLQAEHGLPQAGRVGPLTIALLNSLQGDTVASTLTSVNLAPSRNAAVITFATNELTRGKVYYSPTPITMTEALGPGFAPSISGATLEETGTSMSHTLTVTGLQPNTTYYVVLQATDAHGNITVTNQFMMTTAA
jgi:peptidoglycan hydrolase-like protein with peptidoglycan-binding domain